jgi:hypothetical protein
MTKNSLSTNRADTEAIQHLKQAVLTDKHWYIALLEAIGLWGSAEETIDGRHYRYLIGDEAFDWLSLAERLCLEVDGLVPEEEKMRLLFTATPPIELPQKEFRHLIGETKYRAYLNYLYGVVVEEALLSTVQEEICKEQAGIGLCHYDRIEEEAFLRIYGVDMSTLLNQFRNENNYPKSDSITLTEYKEFTYWLFKYRVDRCEKARVASDTKKALSWLQHQWDSTIKKRPDQPIGTSSLSV